MTDLFLIAHRVRGLPAFDIAIQQTCAICEGQCGGEYVSCDECGDDGYWWIVKTSGHRARPYCCCVLEELDFLSGKHPDEYLGVMPSDWPDHYACNDRHRSAPSSLSTLLNIHRTPLKVDRRF